MSILAFDPRILADRLATSAVSKIKVYEVLLKANIDKLEKKIYCWQRPDNGFMLINDDDISGYVENVIDILEKDTGVKWTDDTTFFSVTDELNDVAEALTGDIE